MDEVASPVRIRLQVFSTSWRFALPWDLTVLFQPDYALGIYPSELFPSRNSFLFRGRCSLTVGVLALAAARQFPVQFVSPGPYHPPVYFDLAAAVAGNQQWVKTSLVVGEATPDTITWASPPLRSLTPPGSPFTLQDESSRPRVPLLSWVSHPLERSPCPRPTWFSSECKHPSHPSSPEGSHRPLSPLGASASREARRRRLDHRVSNHGKIGLSLSGLPALLGSVTSSASLAG